MRYKREEGLVGQKDFWMRARHGRAIQYPRKGIRVASHHRDIGIHASEDLTVKHTNPYEAELGATLINDFK